MASDYCQPGHMHPSLTLPGYQGHCHLALLFAGEFCVDLYQKSSVNFLNDLEVARQKISHKTFGPYFEGFRQYRMIRIGKGFNCDSPRIFPSDAFLIDKYPHQFCNSYGRVGIVELDSNFIRELFVGFMKLPVPSYDIS